MINFWARWCFYEPPGHHSIGGVYKQLGGHGRSPLKHPEHMSNPRAQVKDILVMAVPRLDDLVLI